MNLCLKGWNQKLPRECKAEWSGAVEMVVTAVEMMMIMMIPMKSRLMTVTMVIIFPLREGISPADFSLPESFSLFVIFCLVEAAEYFLGGSPSLRVPGG